MPCYAMPCLHELHVVAVQRATLLRVQRALLLVIAQLQQLHLFR